MEVAHLISSPAPCYEDLGVFPLESTETDYFSSSYQDRDSDSFLDLTSIPMNCSFSPIALPDAFSSNEVILPQMVASCLQPIKVKAEVPLCNGPTSSP